ncbi:hypothetical protein JTB14_006734 [Gonioctena quinquepunctata]|nr:hypothetical protein JTB14_006734 [Gonioctena quinquepunctata]
MMTESANKIRESGAIINELRRANKDNSQATIMNIHPDELNQYYCPIGQNITNNNNSGTDPITYLTEISTPETFYLHRTDIYGLKEIRAVIKNKHATGRKCTKKLYKPDFWKLV